MDLVAITELEIVSLLAHRRIDLN
ncbi:uncharacterized protein METZ01_LOCUS400187 [marine metagenome]|uniref:Uncharacterized protein n=1 Tax=marine metagenome TaxID=408172 RepID=A0A382VLH8_9ZZZZ